MIRDFPEVFDSIMTTHRTFDDLLVTSSMGLEAIKEICEAFGDDIKEFFLQNFLSDWTDGIYVEILNRMPKVEKLQLKIGSEILLTPDTTQIMDLKELKQLKISGVFNADFLLMIAPCQLEELHLNGIGDPRGLSTFIAAQRNIQKLQLPVAVPLDDLKLTHFKLVHIPFFTVGDSDWEMMLRSQQQLVMLDIDDGKVINDRIFNFVRHSCSALEVFKLNAISLSPASIQRIASFQSLRELRVANVAEENLSLLASPTVERLTLTIRGQLTVEDLAAMGEKFPQVKLLNVQMSEADVGNKLKDFVDAFKDLKILRVSFPDRSKFASFCTVSDKFPKLKALFVMFGNDGAEENFDGAELTNLMDALPNAVNLNLQLSFEVSGDIFKQIKKLRNFVVDKISFHELCADFVDDLKQFADSLKTFNLELHHEGIADIAMAALNDIQHVQVTSEHENFVSISKSSSAVQTAMDQFDYEKEVSQASFSFSGDSLI